MPGSSGGTWTLGRLADAEYHEIIVVSQPSSGGDTLTVNLHNCVSAEPQSLEWDDDPAKPMGLVLKFTAHYDPLTPMLVPFDWTIA
jgi:hypothetical protein